MTGKSPGVYRLQDGRNAVLREGEDVVRLEDGLLAGSVMTMNQTVANMMKHTGVCLKDAVRMASHNPASLIGLSKRKGEIEAGMDADIVVFDENIDVKCTLVGGKTRYSKL